MKGFLTLIPILSKIFDKIFEFSEKQAKKRQLDKELQIALLENAEKLYEIERKYVENSINTPINTDKAYERLKNYEKDIKKLLRTNYNIT